MSLIPIADVNTYDLPGLAQTLLDAISAMYTKMYAILEYDVVSVAFKFKLTTLHYYLWLTHNYECFTDDFDTIYAKAMEFAGTCLSCSPFDEDFYLTDEEGAFILLENGKLLQL